MILNLRGTSGSGKTHLARRIMALYPTRMKYHVSGRKQPIGYLCTGLPGRRNLAVIGHYETACGGCDTISGTDLIFDLVRKSDDSKWHVLFEGLLISAEVNRTAALHAEGRPIQVIALSTPLEQCLTDINMRRRIKKPDAPDVNPVNTTSKFKGVKMSVDRLRAQGVLCHVVNRADGFTLAEQLLRT